MCERADSDGHVRIYGEKGKHQKLRLSFFCVCVPLLLHRHLMHQSSERSAIHWKLSNVPFTLLSKERGRKRERKKKHKTGSRRSFRSNSWRPEVMEETRTSPPLLLLLPIDVCNSRRIRSPPRCTHTHSQTNFSLISSLYSRLSMLR